VEGYGSLVTYDEMVSAVTHHVAGSLFRDVSGGVVSAGDVDTVVGVLQGLRQNMVDGVLVNSVVEDVVNTLFKVFPKPSGLSYAAYHELCVLVGKNILVDSGFSTVC
jgi:hypothetical protein